MNEDQKKERYRLAALKTKATKLAKRIVKVCKLCGCEWSEKPSHNWRVFCSRKCASEAKKKQVTRTCLFCGSAFNRKNWNDKRKTCSDQCLHSWKQHQSKGKQAPHDSKWLASIQAEKTRLKGSLSRSGVPATGKNKVNNPNHHKALHVMLRSPQNIVFEVKNIAMFVRQNPHLFTPEDLIPIIRKRGLNATSLTTKAQNGLTSLFKPSVTRGSWKGWTAVSIYERRFNDGHDLLQRNAAK